MSSYKRIPKSLVKKTDSVISINDRYQGEAFGYVKNVTDEAMLQAKENIQAQEKEMLLELESKKEAMVEASYQAGFEKAKDEVRTEIQTEQEEYLLKAKTIYEDANLYYQRLITESEQLKLSFLTENKESILDVIVALSEKLMRQEFQAYPENLSNLFDQMLEQIPYESKKIFIRIHPKAKKQLDIHVLDERIELLPDSTLAFYDFVVETDREFIDARIETIINQLKNLLRGVMHD